MHFAFTEEQAMIVETTRAFVETEIAKYAPKKPKVGGLQVPQGMTK